MIKMPSITALIILGIIPHPLLAQESTPNNFALESYQGTTRTGVDEFVLGSPNAESGRNAVLRSSVFVPSRGERIITEINFDSQWIPNVIQFSAEGAAFLKTWTQLGGRRITFRSVTSDGETARELPRRGVIFAYDPDIPSLLSPLAYLAPGNVTLFAIRTASVTSATLVNHGTESKTVEATAMTLRHLELLTTDGSLHCWFDSDGRLQLVEIPHRNIRITQRTR